MKLNLVVVTPGKMEGKTIPISLRQFLIGRDPECQLRPASPLISKRHCALFLQETKAFVRDFESTNGTFLNDQPIKGDREIKNGDLLKVGPLEFKVLLEITEPATKLAAPVPAAVVPKPASVPAPGSADDEAAAAVLLSLQDDGPSMNGANVDSEGIPTGSTVMDIPSPLTENPAKEEGKGGADRAKAAKSAQGNTSSAAKQILEKYMRRPRG